MQQDIDALEEWIEHGSFTTEELALLHGKLSRLRSEFATTHRLNIHSNQDEFYELVKSNPPVKEDKTTVGEPTKTVDNDNNEPTDDDRLTNKDNRKDK